MELRKPRRRRLLRRAGYGHRPVALLAGKQLQGACRAYVSYRVCWRWSWTRFRPARPPRATRASTCDTLHPLPHATEAEGLFQQDRGRLAALCRRGPPRVWRSDHGLLPLAQASFDFELHKSLIRVPRALALDFATTFAFAAPPSLEFAMAMISPVPPMRTPLLDSVTLAQLQPPSPIARDLYCDLRSQA